MTSQQKVVDNKPKKVVDAEGELLEDHEKITYDGMSAIIYITHDKEWNLYSPYFGNVEEIDIDFTKIYKIK